MKINKINLIYFSPTQTTKKVLQAFAQSFSANISVYDLTLSLQTAQLPCFAADELLVVGTPVYGGRIPAVAEACYQKIRSLGAPAVAIAVYGNRAYDDALLELTDALILGGCQVIGAAAFVGEHSFSAALAAGRPNAEDLNLARQFGRLISAKLAADSLVSVAVPGNRPYKARGSAAAVWGPSTKATCTHCNLCVEHCPMAIINPEDAASIREPTRCLHCGSCVKICPVQAKFFEGEPFEKSMAFLQKVCAERKEPELFV